MEKSQDCILIADLLLLDDPNNITETFGCSPLTRVTGKSILLHALEFISYFNVSNLIIATVSYKEQIDEELERHSSYIKQLLINKFKNEAISHSIRNFPSAKTETDIINILSRIYPKDSRRDFLFLRSGFLYNGSMKDAMLEGIKKYYSDKNSILLTNLFQSEQQVNNQKDKYAQIYDDNQLQSVNKVENNLSINKNFLYHERFINLKKDRKRQLKFSLKLANTNIQFCDQSIQTKFSENNGFSFDECVDWVLNNELSEHHVSINILKDKVFFHEISNYKTMLESTNWVVKNCTQPFTAANLFLYKQTKLTQDKITKNQQNGNLPVQKYLHMFRNCIIVQNVDFEKSNGSMIENSVIENNCYFNGIVTINKCILCQNSSVPEGDYSNSIFYNRKKVAEIPHEQLEKVSDIIFNRSIREDDEKSHNESGMSEINMKDLENIKINKIQQQNDIEIDNKTYQDQKNVQDILIKYNNKDSIDFVKATFQMQQLESRENKDSSMLIYPLSYFIFNLINQKPSENKNYFTDEVERKQKVVEINNNVERWSQFITNQVSKDIMIFLKSIYDQSKACYSLNNGLKNFICNIYLQSFLNNGIVKSSDIVKLKSQIDDEEVLTSLKKIFDQCENEEDDSIDDSEDDSDD